MAWTLRTLLIGTPWICSSAIDAEHGLRRDDVLAIMARQAVHVERGARVGPEVDDKDLLDIRDDHGGPARRPG